MEPSFGQRARRRSGNGRNRPLRVNAPISTGAGSRNDAAARFLRKAGCDYVSVTQVDKKPDGTVLFEFIIEPSLLPQLSKVGASFQRIHWNRLTFEVSSHMPTTSAGGYIMAFRPDPADALPLTPLEAKQWAVATPNSQKNSIWQSAELTVVAGNGRTSASCLPQRQLYTSASADLREYSPGRFVVVVDGNIDSTGSISLSIQWDCTFHVESFEPTVAAVSVQQLRSQVEINQNGGALDVVFPNVQFSTATYLEGPAWLTVNDKPADLVLTNVWLADPLSNTVYPTIKLGSTKKAALPWVVVSTAATVTPETLSVVSSVTIPEGTLFTVYGPVSGMYTGEEIAVKGYSDAQQGVSRALQSNLPKQVALPQRAIRFHG